MVLAKSCPKRPTQNVDCHLCLFEDIDACKLGFHRPAATRPCSTCIRNKQLGVFKDVEPKWDHYRNYEEYMRKIDAFLECPIPGCKKQRTIVNRHGKTLTLKCEEHGTFTETWKI